MSEKIGGVSLVFRVGHIPGKRSLRREEEEGSELELWE